MHGWQGPIHNGTFHPTNNVEDILSFLGLEVTNSNNNPFSKNRLDT